VLRPVTPPMDTLTFCAVAELTENTSTHLTSPELQFQVPAMSSSKPQPL
jgi:hypothetical protein